MRRKSKTSITFDVGFGCATAPVAGSFHQGCETCVPQEERFSESSCATCRGGSYVSASTSYLGMCRTCAAGKYAPVGFGGNVCLTCPAGKTSSTGQASCLGKSPFFIGLGIVQGVVMCNCALCGLQTLDAPQRL